MHDRKKVTALAQGKWKSILAEFGVDAKVLDGKHHPCPVTGEGQDRFRFSNHKGRGSFFCGCNNGSGDGFKLIECKTGRCFKEAAIDVEKIVNDLEPDDDSDRLDSGRALKDLKSVQSIISRNAVGSNSVLGYLASRGIVLDKLPPALHDGIIAYGLRAINVPGAHPCMVAKFVDRDGKPVTFHLTYLKDGRKAKHDRARVVMTPAKPMAGGAVRLSPMGEDGVLGVAEGIETAMSASILFGIPVWACLNAAMLAAFKPPKGCKRVEIFADNDENFTGVAAAYSLATKCKLAHRVDAVVHCPEFPGDYNDVLMKGERNGN